MKELGLDSKEIVYLCSKDKRLAKVINKLGPLSYSLKSDGYEFLVHEIIEQMLSVKAASKIYSRLLSLCDGVVAPERIQKLSDSELQSIGTSRNKVEYIRCLTDSIISKELILDDLADLPDKEVIKKLTLIKGIGNWTAKMYLIFVLDRNDVLPYEDSAFLQSYSWLYKSKKPSKDEIINKTKKWKPYSSIAARYMYIALDAGLTKEEFHLFK